jgi:hypothetical protein
MADVACFCGCCFAFAGTAGACPDCREAVTLTSVQEFAADGADGVESVCVVHWNGPPSAELVRWDSLLPAVTETRN